MGFPGHTLVGIFMFVFSLVGLQKTLRNYILSIKHCPEFKSNRKTDLHCCPNFPCIALLVFVVFTVAFVSSLASTNFRFTNSADGRFTSNAVVNLQHMSMFCPFILHSVMELISSKGLPIPNGLVDVTAAISLAWGAFSIRSEENLTGYGVIIHKLPAYLLYLTACLSLIDFYCNYRNIIASTLKSYFLLCFGTWYIQSNFIMYKNKYLEETPNPEWNQTDDYIIQDMVMAVFGCHLILGQIITAVMFCTMYLLHRREEPDSTVSRKVEQVEVEDILYERNCK